MIRIIFISTQVPLTEALLIQNGYKLRSCLQVHSTQTALVDGCPSPSYLLASSRHGYEAMVIPHIHSNFILHIFLVNTMNGVQQHLKL
ncbi:hypothetical protein E2C01_077465 [Portunus trituberculatus]|uniref:Uncharacterized protein n=1 Tax=Portunus trituberculatus TaxID=210409 RepID=A0A5B7IKB4_PORTR|nr:hypothetical protein [Portunus trituberculatus]